ncbi:MAG: hypothetical protein FVQ85_20200 [Planctomycetes bacterium]|nr:hypothetical protein [Planctomycetota bacterium]
MGDTDIVAPFLDCAAGIVIAAWLALTISYFVLCWKHDRYLKKHFPELSKTESVWIFGGSWKPLKMLSNTFSPGTAPNEYLSLLRGKIRLLVFSMWLTIWLLPIVLFLILVLLLGFEIGGDSVGPNIAYVFSQLSSEERFWLFISFCLLFSGLITLATVIIMVIIIMSKRNKANGVNYGEK